MPQWAYPFYEIVWGQIDVADYIKFNSEEVKGWWAVSSIVCVYICTIGDVYEVRYN